MVFILTPNSLEQWTQAAQPEVLIDGQRYVAQTSGSKWSIRRDARIPDQFRFVVKPGDRWQRDPLTSERSELASDTKVQFGRAVWLSYSIRINSTLPSKSKWVVLGQFHATENPNERAFSPPWNVELDGDSVDLIVRSSPDVHMLSNPEPSLRKVLIAHVRKDTWYKIRAKVTFDWKSGGRGQVNVWVDGNQLVDEKLPVGYNNDIGPYWKFGIYRSKSTENDDITYSDMKLSDEPID